MALRKNGRMTVVAQFGVDLPSHPKMLRIPKGRARGEALGAHFAATCYSRKEEQDGWCPLEALDAVATPETIRRLVDVGLFEFEEKDGVPGVRVLKYEDFNETSEQIQRRLAKDRRRKNGDATDVLPDGFQTESRRNPIGTPAHLGSISGDGDGDGDGDGLDLGVQGGPPPADGALRRPHEVTLDEPIPPEALAFIQTRRTSLKWVPENVASEWEKYVAKTAVHKPRGHLFGGWRSWLIDAERYAKEATTRPRRDGSKPGSLGPAGKQKSARDAPWLDPTYGTEPIPEETT
jgi:hypothetical protein